VSVCVLFDLDGVLLDTEGLYTLATQRVLDRYGKTYDWSLKVQTMGRDARIAARLIVERLGLPLTPEELLAARDPILEQLIEESPAMAGAEAFVRGLHARGVPMAVATSSDRRLYLRKVRPHAWFERFRAVVCGDDPRVRAKKPAPDIFLAAAADLGVAPRDCLVFEDSPAGVEAALAAGMRVVALPPPQASRDLYAGCHAMADGWHLVTPAVLGFEI
jgi:pseudouridine-5'-monophosphatase